MRPSTIVLLVLIIVALVLAWGFRPEAQAVLWHIRHGAHAHGDGLQVRVPLLYSAISGSEGLVIMRQSGRVVSHFRQSQAPSALIFISKMNPDLQPANDGSNDRFWTWMHDSATRVGASVAAKRTTGLGKVPLDCEELKGSRYTLGADIWCAPHSGGPMVNFMGTPNQTGMFYWILGTAAPQ